MRPPWWSSVGPRGAPARYTACGPRGGHQLAPVVLPWVPGRVRVISWPPWCSRWPPWCPRGAPVVLPPGTLLAAPPGPCRLAPVVLPWCSRGAPVVPPRCARGAPVGLRGAPVVLPWCSRGASVVLPWCSRGAPMVPRRPKPRRPRSSPEPTLFVGFWAGAQETIANFLQDVFGNYQVSGDLIVAPWEHHGGQREHHGSTTGALREHHGCQLTRTRRGRRQCTGREHHGSTTRAPIELDLQRLPKLALKGRTGGYTWVFDTAPFLEPWRFPPDG